MTDRVIGGLVIVCVLLAVVCELLLIRWVILEGPPL